MRSALVALALLAAAPVQAQHSHADVDLLLAKDSCRDLLLTYGEGLDEVNPEKIWPLFTQDGVWTADGNVTTHSQPELRELWTGIAANERATVGVHAISNIRFQKGEGEALHGTALVTQHRYDPARRDEITTLGAMMLVKLDMTCVPTSEGWRFSRMALQSVSVANYTHGQD